MNSLEPSISLQECAKWVNPNGSPLMILYNQDENEDRIYTVVDGIIQESTANSAFRQAQGVQRIRRPSSRILVGDDTLSNLSQKLDDIFS